VSRGRAWGSRIWGQVVEDNAIESASAVLIARREFRVVEPAPVALAARLVRSVLLERAAQEKIQVDATKIKFATNLAARFSSARATEKAAIVLELDYRLDIALGAARILTNAHPDSFANDLLAVIYPSPDDIAVMKWAEAVDKQYGRQKGQHKISKSLADTNMAVNLLISHLHQIYRLGKVEEAS
jgi:hypothetical protein